MHNTMKKLRLLFLFILFFSSCGQKKQREFSVFKRTDFLNGTIARETHDTVKPKPEKIDIHFLKKNFNALYFFPDDLISKRHRNEKVIIWANKNEKKDFMSNSSITLIYDSLSRLTNFSYSSCMVCSQLPYSYNVTYNSRGLIDKIYNTKDIKNYYQFYYNDLGNIKQLDNYIEDKLLSKILLLD
jgi:hypothetical protein